MRIFTGSQWSVMDKGVELKLVRGGRIIFACARDARAKIPNLSNFSPSWAWFLPLLSILFQFFLFISLGWPSLQEGIPPLSSSARGTSPFPPPSSTPMVMDWIHRYTIGIYIYDWIEFTYISQLRRGVNVNCSPFKSLFIRTGESIIRSLFFAFVETL